MRARARVRAYLIYITVTWAMSEGNLNLHLTDFWPTNDAKNDEICSNTLVSLLLELLRVIYQ